MIVTIPIAINARRAPIGDSYHASQAAARHNVSGSSRPSGGEQSTGLGLAIVKKLVEAHGGHVAVSSRQHEGSSFSFELPFEPSVRLTDALASLGH